MREREKEIKGESERERTKASKKFIAKNNDKKASPNVSMTQKSMLCRDTAYLKL